MKAKLLTAIIGLCYISFLIVKCDCLKAPMHPAPTTQVKMDMEEGKKGVDRDAWIEDMHYAAPDVSWRQIENTNAWKQYEYKQELISSKRVVKGDIEEFADGALHGKWLERGSDNQAGSILEVAYDQEEDMIYALGAGGTIFKGPRSGNNWVVVNQDLRFNNNYFEVVRREDGSKRLLAAVNNNPHYSDDLGKTWTPAARIQNVDGGRLRDYASIRNNDYNYKFVLSRKDWWSDIQLFYSQDDGESWKLARTFNTSNFDNVALCNPHDSDDLFVMEQISASNSKIYKFRLDNQAVVTLRQASPFSFGEGRSNFNGFHDGNGVQLFAYNGEDALYRSPDEGVSWELVGELPDTPWDVGLYISPSDPDRMFIGGLHSHYSRNSGLTWVRVNHWADYYDDVLNKLHADIMDYEEFETANGEPFLLNSNHGGLNISYNGGVNYTNIGLNSLNVSQYYDVATSPVDPNWIFAGTQDQGFQRTYIQQDQETVPEYEQVISGDYGHNTFTNDGQALWTVYPYGWVTHYSDPYSGYYTSTFQPEHTNNAVWIPPLEAHPTKENTVYLVGCSEVDQYNSKIIELSVTGRTMHSTELDYVFGNGNQLTAMAISELDPDLWFVTNNRGAVFRSEDGGESFELVQDGIPGGHYLYGADIYTSDVDPNLVIISGSGYSNPAVWISTDRGESFSNMSDGLPPTLVFGIDANPIETRFFAATETGPYVFIMNDYKWYPLMGVTAPNQTYWSVEYVDAINTARFGTYGRGAWDFVEALSTSDEDIQFTSNNFKLLANPVSESLTVLRDEVFGSNVNYSIFDIVGNRVLSGVMENKNQLRYNLSVNSLESGTYILHLRNNSLQQSLKFIKL